MSIQIRMTDNAWNGPTLLPTGSTPTVDEALADMLVTARKAEYIGNPTSNPSPIDANNLGSHAAEHAAMGVEADTSLPILCLGGDHPYLQWYGTADEGMGKMYRDRGLKPYMAINTAVGSAAPGDATLMSWEQLKVVESGGCEILGHSHRHVHQNGRIDTGIRIRYLGANATATVHITGTPKTLTLDAETAADASFDLTNASYDTLAKLAAAISAVNGGASWSCTVAEELTGSESSLALLALVAARSVKASGDAEYFAAGSGIIISYTGAAYQTGYVQMSGSAGVDIYLDGVRRASFNTASASYDTLGELVTGINALSVSGLSANLCDDTGGSYRHYTQGDEKSSEIAATMYLDITNTGGIVVDGSGKSNGARLSAGLPFSYLLKRQWQANIDAAAAEGVTLNNWAQSGGGFQQWHLTGQGLFKSYRTNPCESTRFPGAHWSAIGPDYIRTHYVLSSASLSQAQILAAIDALCDSRGAMMDFLCHALTPATPAGKNGYTIQASTSDNEVEEDVWVAVLDYVAAKKAAGQLLQLTPEEARRKRKSASKPQNMIFNQRFRNDATALLGSTSSFPVPGWLLALNGAHVSAASVADGKFSLTTTATTNADFIRQAVHLELGKTYRMGFRLGVPTYTSGSGVRLVLVPRYGRVWGQLPDDTGPSAASAWGKGHSDVSMMLTVPSARGVPPKVRGLIAGTFNISAGSNDTLSIGIDAFTAVAVTLTAGAARTASEVAAEINAAFAASATYTGKQEYWAPATVQGNKVCVASPYIGEEYWNRITITGNGTATVFGYDTCTAIPAYASGVNGGVPWDFIIQTQMQGTFSVADPYCIEVNTSY